MDDLLWLPTPERVSGSQNFVPPDDLFHRLLERYAVESPANVVDPRHVERAKARFQLLEKPKPPLCVADTSR